MNRDEIIRMAREAHRQLVTLDYPGHLGQLDPWTMQLLERFFHAAYAAGAAAEREACEKAVYEVCEDSVSPDAWRCVESIRARGKE